MGKKAGRVSWQIEVRAHHKRKDDPGIRWLLEKVWEIRTRSSWNMNKMLTKEMLCMELQLHGKTRGSHNYAKSVESQCKWRWIPWSRLHISIHVSVLGKKIYCTAEQTQVALELMKTYMSLEYAPCITKVTRSLSQHGFGPTGDRVIQKQDHTQRSCNKTRHGVRLLCL